MAVLRSGDDFNRSSGRFFFWLGGGIDHIGSLVGYINVIFFHKSFPYTAAENQCAHLSHTSRYV